MDKVEQERDEDKAEEIASSFNVHPSSFELAWELIANGRYMPRRIRGSFRGRELG